MHKIKVLIVGQAPRRNVKSPKPWRDGSSAKRLWKWFGCDSYNELRKMASCYYAVPWFEGIAKKGDKVPTKKATLKRLKQRLLRKIRNDEYKKVFLVGRFAQRLVPMMEIPLNVGVVHLPHPSGCNISANHKDEEIENKIWLSLNS